MSSSKRSANHMERTVAQSTELLQNCGAPAANRTQLREEWANRITEAQIAHGDEPKKELFAEATSVYDTSRNPRDRTFEALQSYSRNLSERSSLGWKRTRSWYRAAAAHVLARSLFAKYQVISRCSMHPGCV